MTAHKIRNGIVANIIKSSIALLILLILLDLDTTLKAAPAMEMNPAIRFLAAYMPFAYAVGLFKAVDLAVLGFFYFLWKHSANKFNVEFLCFLSVLAIAYFLVVMNNISALQPK